MSLFTQPIVRIADLSKYDGKVVKMRVRLEEIDERDTRSGSKMLTINMRDNTLVDKSLHVFRPTEYALNKSINPGWYEIDGKVSQGSSGVYRLVL